MWDRKHAIVAVRVADFDESASTVVNGGRHALPLAPEPTKCYSLHVTQEERDRQAADLLLEHRRARPATAARDERCTRLFRELAAFRYNPERITVRDGKLRNLDKNASLPVPDETQVITAVRERDEARERFEDLQRRVAAPGLQ